MNNFLTEITIEEFNKNVPISFKDISYGFNNFLSSTLLCLNDYQSSSIERQFIDLFTYLYDNSEYCYVDLYLCNLTNDELSNLKKLLNHEDKLTLEELTKETTYALPYFKINNKNIIPFLLRLSTREIFFTTFYFPKITIWGNYNLSFPVFYNNSEIYDEFKVICEKFDLSLK